MRGRKTIVTLKNRAQRNGGGGRRTRRKSGLELRKSESFFGYKSYCMPNPIPMTGKRKLRRSGSSWQHPGVMKSKGESSRMPSYNTDDRISTLPDDILHLILSFMSIKEATVTRLFSRRWRYLWTWASFPRLSFDTSILPSELNVRMISNLKTEDFRLLAKQNSEYIKRVNKVLRLYQGNHVEEFRLRQALNQKHTYFVDWCVKFALSREVQKLELDFDVPHRNDEHRMYAFRVGALDQVTHDSHSSKRKRVRHYLCSGRPSLCWSLPGFKRLTSLSFKSVKMGGDVLEGLLSNCPLLETLTLCSIYDLSYIRIFGPSLRLKHLEIVWCIELKEVDIYDVSIVSLKLAISSLVVFRMSKVTRLVELSIPEDLEKANKLGFFSSCHSQLECLKLLPCSFFYKKHQPVCSLSKLTKLRELEIVWLWWKNNLLYFVPVIEALPHLQKIVIRTYGGCPLQGQDGRMELKKAERGVSLQHLKLLVFVGYGGGEVEHEFILHVIENGPALDTIIINPNCTTHYGLAHAEEHHAGCKEAENVRQHAQHWLEGMIPPTVKLVIK
ncbi:unnamed protein product [Linum tenue]|uniref:F-box domain-containing protein n=1 Tax=Linum tenue TaxID=586396 RepID=A0AAV0M1K4_9ROSI|nr:unnamed protein product [Linum tenue]